MDDARRREGHVAEEAAAGVHCVEDHQRAARDAQPVADRLRRAEPSERAHNHQHLPAEENHTTYCIRYCTSALHSLLTWYFLSEKSEKQIDGIRIQY